MVKESRFQHDLIDRLKQRFPGCIVMKNDAGYIQGIPDLTVLNGDKWATLECKQHGKARHQANQDYYVEKMDAMSFSRFIFPENRDEVLEALEQWFGKEME